MISFGGKLKSFFEPLPSPDVLCAWGVGLAFFGLYVFSAGQGPFWQDSGELTSASFTMGSAHPSGFPLYLMLGKLFGFLPLGSVAFRMNLLSSACAGASLGLVAKITQEMGVKNGADPLAARLGGLGAACLLGATLAFWRNATVAEVYMPTLLLLSGCLLLFLRAQKHPLSPHNNALALLCGLGVAGLHATLRLELFLGLAVAWIWDLRSTPSPRKRLSPFFFVLGASVAAYLPLVSSQHPVVDWGHPETLGRLWDHLNASRIRRAFSWRILSTEPEIVAFDLGVFASQLWDGFLGLAPGLAGVGLLTTWPTKNRRKKLSWGVFALLAWIGISDLVYSFWVNPMGLEDLQNGLACFTVIAILCGVGLVQAAQFISKGSPRLTYAVATVLIFLCVVPAALSGWNEKLHGDKGGASIWAQSALEQAPPEGLVLVTSDNLAAGITYLQAVEGARPDIALVVRQHAWDLHHLKHAVTQGIHAPPGLLEEIAAQNTQARHRGRLGTLASLVRWSWPRGGVVWEPGAQADRPSAPPLIPGAPLFRASREPMTPKHLKLAVTEGESLLEGYPGNESRRTLKRHLDACGRSAYRQALKCSQRRRKQALEWVDLSISILKRALRAGEAHPPSLLNLGASLALKGELFALKGKKDKARSLLKSALRLTQAYRTRRPYKSRGLVNEGRYWIKLSEISNDELTSKKALNRATQLIRRAERRGYRKASSSFLLGVAFARNGNLEKAERWLSITLKRKPNHRAARDYLRKVQQLMKSPSLEKR